MTQINPPLQAATMALADAINALFDAGAAPEAILSRAREMTEAIVYVRAEDDGRMLAAPAKPGGPIPLDDDVWIDGHATENPKSIARRKKRRRAK